MNQLSKLNLYGNVKNKQKKTFQGGIPWRKINFERMKEENNKKKCCQVFVLQQNLKKYRL